MELKMIKAYQSDGDLRRSFNRLAEETYGLSFEHWYQNGFWGEKYIPFSVVSQGAVIANVSVNIMDCKPGGETRRYIQLGTVMTKKEYRGQGLSRRLMEWVCREYGECDGMFLWANDSVLDFYPKFGFHRLPEYRYRRTVSKGENCEAENSEAENSKAESAKAENAEAESSKAENPKAESSKAEIIGAEPLKPVYIKSASPKPERLPMETQEDYAHFLREKHRLRSLAESEPDNDGLLMFYLSQFQREAVYYLKELDAYAVAEREEDKLTVYAAYAPQGIKLPEVCRALVPAFDRDSGPALKQVELAFTPGDAAGFQRHAHKAEDSAFFIRGERLAADMERIVSFGELYHA